MAAIIPMQQKNEEHHKEDEDYRKYKPCMSDCERLFRIIYRYLTSTAVDYLLENDVDGDIRNQKITILECYRLLEHMADNDRRGLALKFCIENLQLCDDISSKRHVYEEMITFIINKLYKNELIHHYHCFELHILNTDYKLKNPIDKRKFEFMEQNMHLLDYKEKRNIMKALLVERFEKIPINITENQREKAYPIEQFVLKIMDRENNYMPSLFTITEVFRLTSSATAYIFPRISRKLTNIILTFRPLAEMIIPIGRVWLFPIVSHIGYNSSNNTWKLADSEPYRFYLKPHLPYSTEFKANQSFFLYMMLKQPRGNAVIKTIFVKSVPLITNSKLNVTELLQLFILEAMYECESTTLPTHHPAVQYTWLNLQHLCEFCIFHNNASFLDLLRLLKKSLKEFNYKKARDELMWLFLQHVTINIRKFQRECMIEIAEIYKILYTGNEEWIGSSLDINKMVKFFAPAAIWMCYEKERKEDFPKPSPIIKNHMELFKKEAMKGGELHDGMLIVIGNAISTDKIDFQEKFYKVLLKQLQSNDEEEKWTLPYGRKVDKRLKAIELNSLDCFTFHAKDMIAKHLMCLFGPNNPNIYSVSPAIIESLVRIIMSVEVFDTTKIQFLNLLGYYISNQNLDLAYVIAEAICFKIIDLHMHSSQRHIVIRAAIDGLKRLSLMDQSNFLFSTLEQIVIRSFMWYNPHDMCHLFVKCFTDKNSDLASHVSLPVTEYTGDLNNISMLISPEMVKIMYFTYLKNLKLTGIEAPPETVRIINEYYSFAPSITKYINQNTGEFISRQEINENFLISLVETVHNDPMVKSLKMPEEYLGRTRNNYIIYCVIFKVLEDNLLPELNPCFYKILALLNPKELTLSCNTFIEYLILRFRNVEKEEEKLIKIVNDMIFKHHITTFDRFLLALIMHPDDDASMTISFNILYALLTNCNDLQHRLATCVTFIPRREFSCRADSEKMFKKMALYHKTYPEHAHKELIHKLDRKDDFSMPDVYLPIYYRNLAEIIIPIVDMMLTKAILLNYEFEKFVVILKVFYMVYAYHPAPLSFLYGVLFLLDCDHEKEPLHFQVLVKKIISVSQTIISFTANFYQKESFLYPSADETCTEIVGKLMEGCNIKLIPPKHVARDWRFHEFAPAGQALYTGAIELMFCNLPSKDIAENLLSIAVPRSGENYHEKINAACSLLTALPMSYQEHIFPFMFNAITSDEMVNCKDPKMIFSSIEDVLYHCHDFDSIPYLAVIQTYWQLAPMGMFVKGVEFFEEVMIDIIDNEAQLLYAARIILPFILKMSEAREKFKKDETTKCVSALYDMIGKICSNYEVPLAYESLICDIMYFIKYIFVGDVVRDKAEDVIKKMPPHLQEVMKYYNPASNTDEINRATHTTSISLLCNPLITFQNIPAPLDYEELCSNQNPELNNQYEVMNAFPVTGSTLQRMQQSYDYANIKQENVENRAPQPNMQDFKPSQLQQQLQNPAMDIHMQQQGIHNFNPRTQNEMREEYANMMRNEATQIHMENQQKMSQMGMFPGQGANQQMNMTGVHQMHPGDPRFQGDMRMQQKFSQQHPMNMHPAMLNKQQPMSHQGGAGQGQPMNTFGNPPQYSNMMHQQGMPPYNQMMAGKQPQMMHPGRIPPNFNMASSINPYTNPQQFSNMPRHPNMPMQGNVPNPHGMAQPGMSPIYPQQSHMYQNMPNQSGFPMHMQGHGFNQQRM